ncbi:HAD-IC family P-type ATPase [Dyadobacter sp. CY312]|uniref:HAD-IC family P-type ATPase n=1 Tax=Dyadobacter sp. CY312 TaxID=2907303 RepID=UPI001F346101|nr:HAD-IC family P-type ATPase [Dyadobacter sp. CY312]MCE7041382.1 HAD-IC family P-type ATPase [Dyadobacter sp. CY312]
MLITETALVEYAAGQSINRQGAEGKYPLLQKIPFDSDRMRMATLHQYGDQYLLLVKGAPARITEVLSEKYEDQKEGWLAQNRLWAGEGLRILFFAFKILQQKPETLTSEIEQDLDFLAMAAMIDPPREEVIQAIAECKTAGIRPVMITGDQLQLLTAIAERLHIVEPGEGKPITGSDLSALSDRELSAQVKDISVYARVTAEQKLRIVSALQQRGQFVVMTGDGVNDAPSLKQVNISIAMGITGSDVAKESADMILLDDYFATIIKAVKEGRRIYDNIRKFILYVLSCNLGEILVILCTCFWFTYTATADPYSLDQSGYRWTSRCCPCGRTC